MVHQSQTSLLVTVKCANDKRSVVEISYPKHCTNQHYNNDRYLNDFPKVTVDNENKKGMFQPKSTYYNSNITQQYNNDNNNNKNKRRSNYYRKNSWQNTNNGSMYTNNLNKISSLKPVPLMDIKENIIPTDYYVPYYRHKFDNFQQLNKSKSKYNNKNQSNQTTSFHTRHVLTDLDWDYYDFEQDLLMPV
ncbi:unnamed protein product [Didymodactylos carnosus]|uniref:Uncharacterized protein n=1 Tax=Didymodactylos carnosus TaxID=1234261 RepID=A0A813NJK1_9BILA|nr:unnamed protein product [Didymodactylos carnosus]CAF0740590.1 unnamed protein product [Didymodactylos carnosus]CAF3497291.1 unnamed protein product [Didymodactylos carnosus]CAF3518853.1 unnamed protein product [Didymodactylos carnosus]